MWWWGRGVGDCIDGIADNCCGDGGGDMVDTYGGDGVDDCVGDGKAELIVMILVLRILLIMVVQMVLLGNDGSDGIVSLGIGNSVSFGSDGGHGDVNSDDISHGGENMEL